MITRIAAVLGFSLSLLLGASPAGAEEPWFFEDLDVSDVPLALTEPDVAWISQLGKSYDYAPTPLPEAERSRPTADWSGLSRPLMTEEKGNAAVVRFMNFYKPKDHNSNQWLRFLQADGASPITMACGNAQTEPHAVDAHLLEASHPDGPRYTYVAAWIDGKTCKGLELRRYQTAVRPIAGGLAFVYRTHCAACEPSRRDLLHLVIPAAMSSRATGAGGRFRYWTYLLEHLEITLGEGAAGTAGARIESASITSWNRILPKPLPVADVELRVETSFASGEDEPTIVVATRAANVLPLD